MHKSTAFFKQYETLSCCLKKYGNFDPFRDLTPKDRARLISWILGMISQYQEGELTRQYALQLEALPGWSWGRPGSKWSKNFAILRNYVHTHHTIPTSSVIVDSVAVGRWAVSQRIIHNKGQLTLDRMAQLETIPGWVWNVSEHGWSSGLEHLHAYIKQHGSSQVPAIYVAPDGFHLGAWIASIRAQHRNNAGSPERAVILETLPGWTWNPSIDAWVDKFTLLQEFVTVHGTAAVPQLYVTPDGVSLGTWVSNQRAQRRLGRLSPDRIMQLEALPGWKWATSKKTNDRNPSASPVREGGVSEV